ncbi:MAG: DUF3310 domain-containing protein [Ghiorsea sp.]
MPATNNDPLKTQVGGSHYKDMVIQPIEYITRNNIPYIEGNIIKYISRHRAKGGLENLEKARHYLDMLISTAASQEAHLNETVMPSKKDMSIFVSSRGVQMEEQVPSCSQYISTTTYPIYKKQKGTSLVVEFTDLKCGKVVREGGGEFYGRVLDNLRPHTSTTWEDTEKPNT